MKTFRVAVEEYMAAEEVASKAKKTQQRIALVLRYLGEEIKPTEPVAKLERSHVDRMLAGLRGTVTDASLNAYRGNLRMFGKWLVVNGYRKTDPCIHLKNTKAKTDLRKRKPIDAVQAGKLIEIAGNVHPRDGMTALLMLASALRDSEVRGLTWDCVRFEESEILAWRPKTKDWHVVPMSEQLVEALAAWKEKYEQLHGEVKRDWYVVPALGYRSDSHVLRMHPEWPMAPERPQTALGDRVKRWLREIGETELKGRASHTLRRSAANILIEQGGDIRDAQTMLGHSSVAMTENYLSRDIARDKLRDTVKGFRL